MSFAPYLFIYMAADALEGDGRGEAEPVPAAAARTKRGSSGLPRGVTKSGIKFQGQASWKPAGHSKSEQRSVGRFATAEEAAEAVAAAEAVLAAGGDPWNGKEKLQRQHKRGEAPPPIRKTDRHKGVRKDNRSHDSKGVGRGAGNIRGTNGRFQPPIAAPSIPSAWSFPTDFRPPPMGPLPASVEGVCNVHTAELLSRGELWTVGPNDNSAPPNDLI